MAKFTPDYNIVSGQHPEIERRFLLAALPHDLNTYPNHRIIQGYFESSPGVSARVRLVDDTTAEITKKYRQDGKRIEVNEQLSINAAKLLLDQAITSIIDKTRYYRDGWEIDVFHGPLEGLALAEYELSSTAEKLTIPSWLSVKQEVTDKLSNRMLARIARDLGDEKLDRPITDMITHRVPRIVLTGGPCSGKTSIMEILRAKFGPKLHYVPETASIVIHQVGVKPPRGGQAYEEFQRTIYRIQRGLETITDFQAANDNKHAVIIDRGTVDGAAYLPNGIEQLETICQTSVQHQEYPHYDLIVHLATPTEAVYEENKGKNPARKDTNESYEQAVEAGQRLHDVWSKHPNFKAIPDFPTFEEKIAAVEQIIRSIIKPGI